MKPRQITKNPWGSSSSQSVGFEALVQFYRTATPNQILQLEDACKNNNWNGFMDLIMKARVPTERETTLPPSSIKDADSIEKMLALLKVQIVSSITNHFFSKSHG